MNESTAVELLKEYLAHHGDPMDCGTAYISRSFADADAEIMNRIREFLETMED